ncbi:MAG TPA: ribosome maturation factor RimP [Gammaproteobacteria bacterium]|nr:ribosome maturation factor RimP [Gammaproteobacteria bacterium]
MYRQNRQLLELLLPVVDRLGYELLGIEQHARGRDSVLRLYIDKETGIGLDDCARVSEQVAGVLDVHDPVQGSYTLEVSSPGLDRPLFTLEQFRRFCGQRVKVNLHRKLEGRRKLIGEIKSAGTDNVVISADGNIYEVAADNIDKARLVPDSIN